MKRNPVWSSRWAAAALLALALGLVPAAARAQDKLSSDEQRWLEDVGPIMTRAERDVFLHLRNKAERDKFAVFFWRSRDASPDTTENEFYKDYMDRVAFADKNFGHDSPKRGSQTERGYFYLLLGRPLERTYYTTESQLWPLELWFYKGAVEYGQPDYFYLIFYQPGGLGDYRLYYPGIEGPEKLIVPGASTGINDRQGAFQRIRDVNAELASASLSYMPGERPGANAGFSSDSIIATVKQMPEKKYSDAYARSFLTFKDFIETEYSDRYLPSAVQVRVFRDRDQPFVHWTIEPEKMNFGAVGDQIQASFELVLRLEDRTGRAILERTEEIPLRLTADQYKAHERQRFAFQDLLPVIPGDYKFLVLMKNKTARDFSSTEMSLAIPAAGRPGLSVPLLHHGQESVPEAQKKNLKAFVLEGTQYAVGASNEFLPAESLGVYVQAWNLKALNLPGPAAFSLEIFSLDAGASAGVFPMAAAPDPSDPAMQVVTATVPLSDVKPGYYRAVVTAAGPDGRPVLSEKENFIVLSKPLATVPWAYARLHGPFPGAEHLRVLGAESFLAGDHAGAVTLLEKALTYQDDAGTRLLLAKALYGLNRFKESLAQALPLYERTPDRETAKVLALDYAGLSDWSSAVGYLERLMAEATEISVLNLAADCYLNLSRPEKALPLLQKSLSLLPGQPRTRDLEEKTRKLLDRK
jgi:GWxTD domain-containing protein